MRYFDQKWMWAAICVGAVACGGQSSDSGDGDGTSSQQSGDGDGDGDLPSGIDDKEASCQEICQLAEECGTGLDGCEESCTDNESISNVGQSAITTCLADAPCEPDENDLFEAILCVTDELEDIELSEAQEAFCSDTSKRVQQCSDSEPDTTLGDCEAQVVLLSDELLSDINACDQEDCDALSACVGLQIIQALDVAELSELSQSGELSSGALADLLALAVLGSQLGDLGQDTSGFLGSGGAFP